MMTLSNKTNYTDIDKKREKITFLIVALIFILGLITIIFRPQTYISFIGYTSVLILFIICVFLGRKEKYLFNPYYLFLITPFSLFIYTVNVSPYYLTEISSTTWLISVYNIAMFIGGLWLVTKFSRNRSNPELLQQNASLVHNPSVLSLHAYITLMIGMTPVLFGLISGFQTFLDGDLIGIKEYMVAMPLASIFSLFKYLSITFAMKSKRKVTILIVMCFCLFSVFMNISKFEIMIFVIAILISYIKYFTISRKTKFVFVILFLLSAVAIYLSFEYFDVLRGYNTANDLILKGRFNKEINEGFVLPYMYLTTPWVNLQYVMETNTFHTYGLWLMKPFLGYLQIDGELIRQYTLTARSSFNTFTFITVFFKDFGLIGSGFMTLFLGGITGRIYTRFKYSNNSYIVAIYSLNAMAIAMMFFSNHYLMLSYPITIILITGVYKLLFRKRNN